MPSPIVSSTGRVYDRKMMCAAARRSRYLRICGVTADEIGAVVDVAMKNMAGCVPSRVIDQIMEEILLLRASRATGDAP